MYVGVHIPKSFHRRRRHRRKSSHKERRERPAERGADDDGDKSDGDVVDEAAVSILKPLSESNRSRLPAPAPNPRVPDMYYTLLRREIHQSAAE